MIVCQKKNIPRLTKVVTFLCCLEFRLQGNKTSNLNLVYCYKHKAALQKGRVDFVGRIILHSKLLFSPVSEKKYILCHK